MPRNFGLDSRKFLSLFWCRILQITLLKVHAIYTSLHFVLGGINRTFDYVYLDFFESENYEYNVDQFPSKYKKIEYKDSLILIYGNNRVRGHTKNSNSFLHFILTISIEVELNIFLKTVSFSPPDLLSLYLE